MLAAIPLIALLLLILLFQGRERSWRSAALAAAVTWGLLVTVITEALSLFYALTTVWVAACWTLLCGLSLGLLGLRMRRGPLSLGLPNPPPSRSLRAQLAGLAFIVATTGLIALLAPPNTWDSMTFHMSRVAHWIQNHSVAHYPTHMTTQLQRGPWAEFAILHLDLLSGGDRLSNMVQWLSMVGSVLGATLLAKQLGAEARGQVLAGVAAGTIPMGILEASSTQTDYVGTFWLVCFVHFVLLLKRSGPDHALGPWPWLAGTSLGLAILTKATAYLYAFPLLVWWAGPAMIKHRATWWRACLPLALMTVIVNLGAYLRNLDVFGSPIGFVQEACAGCRYSNEEVSAALVASNVLRNTGIHLGTPFMVVNETVQQGLERIHALLGVDINDPRSTWVRGRFQVRQPGFDENFDGNPLHFLFLGTATALAMFSVRLRRNPQLRHYALALMAGALVFCLYLKWNVNHSRLHLALFVLGSPIIGVALGDLRWRALSNILAVFLIVASLPWLLLNTYRPLIGERTIFNTDRTSLLFIHRPNLEAPFRGAALFLTDHRCFQVGLIRGWDDWEYPLWTLLQDARAQQLRIQHEQVTNESAALLSREPFRSFTPCATVTVEGGRVTVSIKNPGPDPDRR